MGFIPFFTGCGLGTNPSFLVLFVPVMIMLFSRYSPFTPLFDLPSMGEFHSLTYDILYHGEFIKLKKYFHHTHHIYDHVVRVAYLSYFFSKLLGLDYTSAARGGLFHDFFLYDWRERKKGDEHHSLHGKEHPYIALNNARHYFTVNEKEKDIITKHMYPKTKERPVYAESFIVSLMDKVSTIIEYGKRFFYKSHTSYKKAR